MIQYIIDTLHLIIQRIGGAMGKPHDIRAAKAKLRQTAMLRLWLAGYTAKEVGKQFGGISPQAVNQVLQPVRTPELRATQAENLAKRKAAQDQRVRSQRYHAFVALLEAGTKAAIIKTQLSLTPSDYHALLAEVDETLIGRWRHLRRIGHTKYTEEDCLEAIAEAAGLNNDTLTQEAYINLRRHYPDWPAIETLKLSRSWNEWLAIAGLPIKRKTPQVSEARYSQADCQAAIARVISVYGRSFTRREYMAERQAHEPSISLIENRYGHGRWLEALRRLAPASDH